jgi:acyl-CoA synthetase (AMP-forming)/AMP-acid ligase II
MLACFKTGLGVVPINARLHPEEVCYHVRGAEAAALVYGPEFTDAIASIRPALPDTRHFISLIASASWELDFESLVRSRAGLQAARK